MSLIDLIYEIASIVLVINLGLVFLLIFYERRDPARVIAWTILLLALPLIGFILYLLLGLHYFRDRRFQLKAKGDRELLQKIVTEQKRAIEVDRALEETPELDRFDDLAQLLLSENSAILTRGNHATVFTDGEAKFAALFEVIRSAQSSVHLEYYIIRNDDLGHRLIAALTEKAKQGVEIRFLHDDLGNNLPKRHYRELISAGGRVSGFYRSPIPTVSLRVNYRNHRKLAVIDGRVGFIGGFNIGDEYLGKGRLGHWRDTAVRIEGKGVAALQLRFLVDWKYSTNEELGLIPKYFPDLPPATDGSRIQVVSGGPDTYWNPTKEQYLKMIGLARKTFYLQTPYFIPDPSVLDALRVAALSGVDVRIMIPAKGDAPFVRFASRSFLGELLDAGAKGYLYTNGFLHAKTATVDDLCSSIGSTNWDIRSFRWNFESNAVIYSASFARQQRAIFEADLKDCTELTLADYRRRSVGEKFAEGFSRLFSGVL